MADEAAFASGFFGISLSDSESENDITTTTTDSPAPPNGPALSRADRTALSEPAFQALKSSYRPKVENGEIHSAIALPLSAVLTKPQAQDLLHAVEELYFFRRYREAAEFTRRALGDGDETAVSSSGGVDGETKSLLRQYLGRCEARAQSQPPAQGEVAKQ
ncbi:hypothetical protein B0H67DRAFT_577113 [Lasiosphaeris hirsuta]|uniref:Uncharacterized protein n=1 Tax=Lasiosphaeris hirsuta TaxID=260670 RepID=A0AA40ARK5_9PEZI|nr:hypothetical protein B0H67DRAFT_577113 [Lasiosphaeris hirsuta]